MLTKHSSNFKLEKITLQVCTQCLHMLAFDLEYKLPGTCILCSFEIGNFHKFHGL